MPTFIAYSVLTIAWICIFKYGWKHLVPISFKMRLLCCKRLLFSKHYHLMTRLDITKNESIVQHVSSAYSTFDEKWTSQCCSPIEQYGIELLHSDEINAHVDAAKNILNGTE